MDWKSKKYELPNTDWRYKREPEGLGFNEYMLIAAVIVLSALTLFCLVAFFVR